jgi:hypothetical protein
MVTSSSAHLRTYEGSARFVAKPEVAFPTRSHVGSSEKGEELDATPAVYLTYLTPVN